MYIIFILSFIFACSSTIKEQKKEQEALLSFMDGTVSCTKYTSDKKELVLHSKEKFFYKEDCEKSVEYKLFEEKSKKMYADSKIGEFIVVDNTPRKRAECISIISQYDDSLIIQDDQRYKIKVKYGEETTLRYLTSLECYQSKEYLNKTETYLKQRVSQINEFCAKSECKHYQKLAIEGTVVVGMPMELVNIIWGKPSNSDNPYIYEPYLVNILAGKVHEINPIKVK